MLNVEPPEGHAAVAEVARVIGLGVPFPPRCGSRCWPWAPNVAPAADGEAG
jgi:hypothetical protein